MPNTYASGGDLSRLDRGESIFFARAAESIKTQTYDAKLKELKAFVIIPINTSAGPGARTITFRRYTGVGIAKIINDYAHDLPKVDVYGKEETINVHSLGTSYGYNIMEIRSAAMVPGANLELRRALTARRAHDEKVNDIAFRGDAEYNIKGLLNYPGVTEATLPADGVSGSTKFRDKTTDQVLRDINILTDAINIPTYGREMPDTLLLPLPVYNFLANKRLSEHSEKTLLRYILDNNPAIKRIEWLNELAGAGKGKTDRAMLGKFDEMYITLELPQPFEQFDPLQQGLEYTIPCFSRCAGVIIYYPMAFCYADGI
ncbi:MAG: DUF2184 domain-containing protein [Treponema sp.]|jgi:hypothetical protein|nr:DUF2184 domain-containing protein [Treponema sp.]